MPYTTSTGHSIADDFFKETSTVSAPITTTPTDPQEISLPATPPEGETYDQPTLDGFTQNGKVVPPVQVTSMTERKCKYELPAAVVAPHGLIAPNCEVYVFKRTCRTIEKRYIALPQGRLLLFSYKVVSTSETYDYVMFCGPNVPVILESTVGGTTFPNEPPPLVPGKSWYWSPPEIIDETGIDTIGSHQWPEQDGSYHYHVRMVLMLRRPIRIDGCVLTAQYDYAWRVTRIRRSDGAPETSTDAAPNPSFHRINGGRAFTYRIPNCPPVVNVDPKVPEMKTLMNDLHHSAIPRVWIRRGESWDDVKLAPQPTDGILSFTVDPAIGLPAPKVTLRALFPARSVVVAAGPELRDYLRRAKPAGVFLAFEGFAEDLGGGLFNLEPQNGTVEGFLEANPAE